MKIWLFPFFLTALFLMSSGCATVLESQPESTPLSGSEVAQTIPLSASADDVDHDDEFQTFIETWKLSGLIPEGLIMTMEQRGQFMEYFNEFDDVTRNYVILLLQGIAAGTITVTDDYDDHQNGVYLSYCQLCLIDMNKDGFPELILKTGGDEAGYWYTVYTIIDDKLIDCGGISGGHASLSTNGSGGFVRYESHMGCYNVTVSILEGTMLTTQEIADGELDYSKNEDYPELKEYGYGDYDQYLQFNGIPTLMLAPAG